MAVLVVSSLAPTACHRAEVVSDGSTNTGAGTTLPPSAERVSAPDFPLTVTEGGTSTVRIDHTVEPPDL